MAAKDPVELATLGVLAVATNRKTKMHETNTSIFDENLGSFVYPLCQDYKRNKHTVLYIYILTFIYTSFPNHVFLTQFSLTWISTQPPPKKQHTQTHTSVSGKGPMVQFQSFQMQGFSIPKSSKATHLRGSCIGKTSFGRIFCFGFCGKKTWWEIIHLFEDVGECPNKI